MDTISEELFMLYLRDDGKPEAMGTPLGYALVAALTADLAVARRVELSEDKDPKVTVVDETPTGHGFLDPGLARMASKQGRRMSMWIPDTKLDPHELVAASLAKRGVIDITDKKLGGLIPPRYPVLDPEPEREVRERLERVLAGEQEPTLGDTTLLAILNGSGMVPKVLRQEGAAAGLSAKELKARVKELATPNQAGDAVARSVESLNVAIMTAIIMPTVISLST